MSIDSSRGKGPSLTRRQLATLHGELKVAEATAKTARTAAVAAKAAFKLARKKFKQAKQSAKEARKAAKTLRRDFKQATLTLAEAEKRAAKKAQRLQSKHSAAAKRAREESPTTPSHMRAPVAHSANESTGVATTPAGNVTSLRDSPT